MPKTKTLSEKIIDYMSENAYDHISAPDMAEKFINVLHTEKYGNKTKPQLAAEINSNIVRIQESGKEPKLKYVEGSQNPKRYYYDIFGDSDTTAETKQKPKGKHTKKEEPLYDLLIEYLKKEKNLYAKRIEGLTRKLTKL